MTSSFGFFPLAALITLTTGCTSMVDFDKSGPLFDEGTDDCEETEETGTDGGTESLMPDEGAGDGGTDTGTDDTGGTDCEFEVLTADGGEAVMANTLAIEKAQSGASGAEDPSEELRVAVLQFSPEDPACSPLALRKLRFLVFFTDNASSDWLPQNIWGVDGEGNTHEAEVSDMGGLLFIDFELDYQIEAGGVGFFGVVMNTMGASTDLDDEVRVDLFPDSLEVDDGTTSATLAHDGLAGNTIVF